MRNIIIVLLALCLLSVDRCSDMPRRYLGLYSGISPKTTLTINGETASVEETPIQLVLSEEKLNLMIGQANFEANYTIKAVTKVNFSIVAQFDEPLGENVFSITKKGKKAIWKRPMATQEIILLKE